ncbi:MAG: phosphoribosyltransferase [Candidatus Hermodarchaeota archaeon]
MNPIKYESRLIAGEILADFIKANDYTIYDKLKQDFENFFCYAIPNGGVPVVEGFCSQFKVNYDLLIVRKLKIPYNTEAGFGAVTTDGTVFFNQVLLNQLNLTKEQINNSISITKDEIRQRIEFYGKDLNLIELQKKIIQNKNIFLIDDGLASGFTMLAGINMIKKYKPKSISIVVPTAPLRTVELIEKEVDHIYCPNIRNVRWFAVADSYKHWYDVPDGEVLEIINNSKCYILNK